jgi:hypothetical protein
MNASTQPAWSDIEPRLEVRDGFRHREPIERLELSPSVISGEASAHQLNIDEWPDLKIGRYNASRTRGGIYLTRLPFS